MAYIAAEMPKRQETKRAEVHLMPDVVKDLQKIADNEKRSLKNLMEYVLEQYAKANKKKK